ncbi:Calcium-activated potassium channel slowpoke [Gracilariopsis chorda]|uniref:Calcium-activated potassium channel slowpoke n=1 Tax=Gracilariopsis chorda TaxID=448386 RepID=A0A2V3ITT4_9FLOR|nr:Calcium-activated potassium channel slowpoke [Gracilariopsis chorda]|eukprot:PXF45524.1 Calcium-activated potassium channel slowpoke [Gracilariopsis chorda]
MFAFSLRTIVEALSIPSLLFSSGARWLNFNFLQAYCILAEWYLLEKHDIVMRNTSTLTRLLINLFLQLLTFLFITSCGVQFFELLGDPSQVLRSETFQITWANSVYFAVVTLMTVGYGDFVPYTLFGRMWIVFHIIFAAYLVSREISLLIDALKSMRRGGGSYVNSSGTDHVVVTGKVKWEFLQQFVKEFLAEGSNLDTRIIVLTSNPTWTDDDWHKFVSHNPLFDHHLMYLDGSALNLDDLGRAQVGSAKGVFVLADPHRQDPYREDSDILKAVLTVRNYSGQVPIYALNTLAESSFQFGIAAERVKRSQTFETSHDSNLQSHTTPASPISWAPPQNNAIVANRNDRFVSFDELPPGYAGVETRREGSSAYGVSGHAIYPTEFVQHSITVSGEERNGDEGFVTPQSRRSRKRENRLSQSLCMQELETVLLAENTFCNGLSTLIANATLRIAPQSSRNDRPWLVEYKLGAECSIQEFLIRREMDGISFGRIATVLQDYGLVLLAVRERSEDDWSILGTSTILKSGMSTMAMTYHDPIVVDRIADLAAKYIREKQIRISVRPGNKQGHKKQNRVSGVKESQKLANKAHVDTSSSEAADSGSVHRQGANASDGSRISRRGSSQAGYRAAMSPDVSDGVGSNWQQEEARRPNANSKAALTRSLSTTTARSHRKTEAGDGQSADVQLETRVLVEKNTTGGRRYHGLPDERGMALTPPRPLVYTSVDKLPAALRGHVIICLEGESPLLTLEALLRRVWMPRTGQKKKAPVVVIHPRFPKTYVRTLQRERDHLFLLQGNSLSLETLRQAQYQSARAVLIMTSESDDAKGQGSTDSKAIFTVMTLDSLLADRDTFVCCILDAEESLQLLRAPKQPRRVGVNLGEQREPDVFNLSAFYDRSPTAGAPKRTASSTNFVKSVSSTPFTSEYGSFSPYGGTFGAGLGFHPGSHRDFPSRSGKAMRMRLKGMSRSNSMRVDGDSSDEEYHSGLDLHRLPEQHYQQQMSREELYERQRYASGEMVISSLFTALLARDYTDPGYIRLIRQLIGASSASAGSWIRQVDIPESWTRAENEIDGRTYRDTSIRLLKMGCIALGLYRSGDAPVRVETKSDQWERRADEVVYHEEEDISRLRQDAESRSVASRIVDRNEYANRLHGRVAVGRRTQDVPVGKGAVEDSGVSFHERFAGGENDNDEFDQMYYTCPTTRRRIFYYEAVDGANVLPYVYSCPEPYSLVAASDAVFVLCDPKKEIPINWDEG